MEIMARYYKKSTFQKSSKKKKFLKVGIVLVCLVGLYFLLKWLFKLLLMYKGKQSIVPPTPNNQTNNNSDVSGGLVNTSDDSCHGINNPGNILYDKRNNWQGQTGYNQRQIGGTEYRYCNFDTMENGLRALQILIEKKALSSGISQSQLKSLDIVDTDAVANTYAAYAGCDAAVAYNFASVFEKKRREGMYLDNLTALVSAVCYFETGKNVF